MRHRLIQVLAVGLAMLFVPAVVSAATGFSATLDNAQTVGTCPGGSAGAGMGVFILNDAETELSYNITFAGLSGPVNLAHFHNAPAGANGAAVRALTTTSPIVGVWKSTDAQPLTPDMVTELKAGRLYINLHTDYCPGGEIRGQIYRDDTVQVSHSSWGHLKAIYR